MRTLFLVFCTILSLCCYGQTYETIKVIGPELYKLNSTSRNDLGGRSRLYVPLRIPANAVFCYITISTASGNESEQIAEGIHLLGQIAAKVPSATTQGISTLATLSEQVLNVYKGSVVDAYLLGTVNDAQLFTARSTYAYFPQYSRKNFNGGTIALPTAGIEEKTIYFGFANNNAINAVWLSIEAVAVVSKPDVEAEKALIYTNLGWKSYENDDIYKCIAYSQKAIIQDNANYIARFNIGLCYLIKNEDSTAVAFYTDALSNLKQQSKVEIKHYLREALKDIENARKRYPSMATAEEIVSILNDEYISLR